MFQIQDLWSLLGVNTKFASFSGQFTFLYIFSFLLDIFHIASNYFCNKKYFLNTKMNLHWTKFIIGTFFCVNKMVFSHNECFIPIGSNWFELWYYVSLFLHKCSYFTVCNSTICSNYVKYRRIRESVEYESINWIISCLVAIFILSVLHFSCKETFWTNRS